MKIAMLGHKRIPSREGGIEVVVEELAARMAAMGHEVTCYNRRGRHIGGDEFAEADQTMKEYRNIRIKWVPTLDRRGLAAFTAAISASVCTLFNGYDIVHFHAEGPSVMCWLPKLFGKKVVVTIHGLDHRRGKWGKLAKSVIIVGEKCAARWADAVIVLSEDVRRYFKDTYGLETKLIYNGASETQKRRPELISKRYGLSGGDYLLYLGRLVPEKGIDSLIRAYRQNDTDKKLVIAGGGSDSGDYVKKLHEMADGDERIIFTGFVQGQTLEELYSNAYIYILPSLLEGMPLSLLEAMSYGCCCLTSDIPECTDVTGDAGFSFKAGDSDDLDKMLTKLCASGELCAEYGEKAEKRVLSLFSWDKTTKQTLEVYESVLERGKKRR